MQKNKENKSRPTDKRKVKPRFYGEALTVNDVYQRLAEEEREKEGTRKRKAMKARSSTRLTDSKVARKVQDRVGPRDEEKFAYPQTIVAPTLTVSRRKSHFLMVRKEPQVQRLKKIFARNVMRERMMPKSAEFDVIPVYGGFTIIVLVLQVSQMDFGLAPIV